MQMSPLSATYVALEFTGYNGLASDSGVRPDTQETEKPGTSGVTGKVCAN